MTGFLRAAGKDIIIEEVRRRARPVSLRLAVAAGVWDMKDRLGAFLENWRIRAVLPLVRGRLLDLGCGLNHLVRRYGDGVGADVHQWGDVDEVIEDAGRLPFADEAFDTVTILAALNHIPNRAEALREVRRVLRPGGRFVMTMIPPTLSRVWHRLRRPWDPDQTERGMKEGEVWGLSRGEERRLLADAGLRVEHQSRFMLWINRLTVARKPGDGAAALSEHRDYATRSIAAAG